MSKRFFRQIVKLMDHQVQKISLSCCMCEFILFEIGLGTRGWTNFSDVKRFSSSLNKVKKIKKL